MKAGFQSFVFLFIASCTCFGDETKVDSSIAISKDVAVSGSAVLTQALGRVDLAISSSRVNMRHLQGDFGERLTSAYLNRGAEWTPMRQSVGRQGIDMLHLKVDPDGRIKDMMVSEVKTGSSRLGQTASGQQASFSYNSARLKGLAVRYQKLSKALARGEMKVAKVPRGIGAKHLLEVPLGNKSSALFWRENSLSPWKLSAKPSQVSTAESQAGRIAHWLDACADGKISYRSRIFRGRQIGNNWVTTVKNSSPLDQGIPESKLPVLERIVSPVKGGGALSQSLTTAWANELRRTQPFLTDREVMSQARELVNKTIARNQGFKPVSLGSSLAKGFGAASASGGLLTGAIDLGVQLLSTGEVDFQQVGANSLAGAASAGTGYLAGSGVTYALMNTTLGLNLSRQVATSMGISTSCSANLLGTSAGGSIAAAVFAYGLYFMGYVEMETANRMAVAGVAGSVVGTAALTATTSLVAAYATAGTGTAISTLSGAAATSATMAAIGGGSAAVGTALAATGFGLVVVGVGAGVMWGFTAYDESQETKRLELTAEYLSKYYGELSH